MNTIQEEGEEGKEGNGVENLPKDPVLAFIARTPLEEITLQDLMMGEILNHDDLGDETFGEEEESKEGEEEEDEAKAHPTAPPEEEEEGTGSKAGWDGNEAIVQTKKLDKEGKKYSTKNAQQTGLETLSFTMESASIWDPGLLSHEALRPFHIRRNPILKNHPVVLLVSFPRNGNHYLRNLVHAMGTTTHSLHSETPDDFPALNTTYFSTISNLSLSQPAPSQPFLIKTHYPALQSNLLPVNYSSIVFFCLQFLHFGLN